MTLAPEPRRRRESLAGAFTWLGLPGRSGLRCWWSAPSGTDDPIERRWQTLSVAPLPYSDSGARIAFYVVLGVFVVLEQRIRLKSLLNRHGVREDRGSLLVVIVAVAAGLAGGCVIADLAPSAAIPAARWPIYVLGLALMCAGIALRQWAVALLGQFFTVDIRVHPDQTVIEQGPYRWIQHPSYTGMLITFVGIGLALGNWAALALLIVLPTAGFVIRIRVEERALLDGLGEPYRRFAASRCRLVPGVW